MFSPASSASASSQTSVPRAWVVSLTTPEGGRIANVYTAQLRSVVTRLAGRGVTPGAVRLYAELKNIPILSGRVLEQTL